MSATAVRHTPRCPYMELLMASDPKGWLYGHRCGAWVRLLECLGYPLDALAYISLLPLNVTWLQSSERNIFQPWTSEHKCRDLTVIPLNDRSFISMVP